MLIDAHLHLGMFPEPLKVCLEADAHNIALCAVSTSLEETVSLLEKLESSQFSPTVFAGIHPWYLDDSTFDGNLLEMILKNPLVRGIGECGLDGRIQTNLQEQEMILEKHLEIASLYHFPVNLHIRGVHGQLDSVLKRYRGKVRGMIHNFTFSKEIARQYLDLGFKLSIGHHILQGHEKLLDAIKYAGVDSVLLETDLDYEHTNDYQYDLIFREYDALAQFLQISVAQL
ncbi:MAG: TatD family hydrolase, partial [Succinivibrio sp.]